MLSGWDRNEYVILLGLVCECKGTDFSADMQYLEMMILIFDRKVFLQKYVKYIPILDLKKLKNDEYIYTMKAFFFVILYQK